MRNLLERVGVTSSGQWIFGIPAAQLQSTINQQDCLRDQANKHFSF
jgi:hypothetical protein